VRSRPASEKHERSRGSPQRDVTTSDCVTLTMRRWCQCQCVITWPENIDSDPAVTYDRDYNRDYTSGAFYSVVETIDPSTRARVKFFRGKLAPSSAAIIRSLALWVYWSLGTGSFDFLRLFIGNCRRNDSEVRDEWKTQWSIYSVFCKVN